MGCGVSRPFDGNGLVLPAKLRPIFLHRLEEIKMRRQAHPLKDTASTPSKKELLLYDHHDLGITDEDEHASSSKSAPFSPIQNVSHNQGKKKLEGGRKEEAVNSVNNEKDRQKNYDVSHDDGDDDGKKKEKKGKVNEDGIKGKDVDDILTDVDNFDEDDDDDIDDDDDDDDERMIGRDRGDGDFPGSPSFRVYFKDDGGDKKIDIGQKNASKGTIPSDDTAISKESSESKKVKRGKKKKSFRRRVLPKGGQAAVKNLFNAASCYTPPPSAAAHDHHAHLLTGKTNG